MDPPLVEYEQNRLDQMAENLRWFIEHGLQDAVKDCRQNSVRSRASIKAAATKKARRGQARSRKSKRIRSMPAIQHFPQEQAEMTPRLGTRRGEEESHFQVGGRVAVEYSDGALWPGEVVGFDSASSLYSVRCDDGELLEDVSLHEMLREAGASESHFQVGGRVAVEYSDGALWPGEVVGFDGASSLYSVRCDDGELLEDVSLHEMLREAGASAAMARTSGFRGVHWKRTHKKWAAKSVGTSHKTRKWLGLYSTEAEASAAVEADFASR